jgi:hypothetical protein
MAVMVPAEIPSKASQGEKTLFGILRDNLPDDFIIWYEPIIEGSHPDFVILGPTLGLLILEVKGWHPNQIVGEANNDTFRICYKRSGHPDRIETQASPLRQAHRYFSAAINKLKAYPLLQQPNGEHQGNCAFPIGTGAVMSNMTEAQAHERGIYPLLKKPRVAYRDELLDWGNFSDREFIKRLKSMFEPWFSFPALTEDQISTIKGAIYPEVKIREEPATKKSLPPGFHLLPNSKVIKVMDDTQEALARRLTSGHHIFSGVAGSGKTLILLARAKIIANQQSDHRILILCYNITLAAYLRSLLHGDAQNPQYKQKIEVRHFHDWAKSILGNLPRPLAANNDQQDDLYDEQLGEKLLLTLTRRSSNVKWDAVLVAGLFHSK